MGGISHSDGRAFAAAVGHLAPETTADRRTTGVVTKVEPDGTVWVRLRNSASETPCARTIASAKPNDQVIVSIEHGRATVEGNMTSPATDDAKAEMAIETGTAAERAAASAHEMAESAISDAQAARGSAESASASASSAASSAASASTSASSAASSAASAAGDAASASASAANAASSADSAASDASSAMSSALSALTQLGTVEDVMGTLSWLRDHEVYMPATSFDAGETYFEFVDGKYVEVENPVADDIADYYVYDHHATMAGFVQEHLTLTERGLYITMSKPTEYQPDDVDYYEYDVARSFDPDETYYQLFISESGTWYQQVENPVEDGVGSYYVRRCNAGGIRPMGKGYLLLTDQDVRVFGPSGRVIARYGYDIELGDSFLGKGVAHIDGNSMEITNADISERLNLGNWSFEQRENGNLTLTWKEA